MIKYEKWNAILGVYMKVLIVGLGLIGGSYAMGLSKCKYEVYGVDNNLESVKYAKDNKYIIDGSNDPTKFLPFVDLVIICLYPTAILSFLKKYNKYFNANQIITDVCGVKTSFIYDAIKEAKPAKYISHHPMAGREKSGIMYCNCEIFKNMNFLVIDTSCNEEDLNVIKQLGKDLTFNRITVITPQYHDKMIGFTSQLTHAIAVCLVNSDTQKDTKNFIGDSYRDLTRIAMINEELWSELFLSNKNYLIDEIENFEYQIKELKHALVSDDVSKLKEMFVKSKKKRSEMEK